MKTRFFYFYCLILLSFSCGNEEAKLRYAQLKSDLIGQWILVDIPAAEESWQFNDDGSYLVKMGKTEDHGTWELDKDVLVLDGDHKNEEIIVIENDQLDWGDYHFKKSGIALAAANAQLDKKIVGAWKLVSNEEETTYEFFDDGTYELMLGNASNAISYPGKWSVKEDRLILDGQTNSARKIRFEENQLVWRGDQYNRLQRTPLKGDLLANRLRGSWFSDEVGSGVQYNFEEDGRFKSHDGRYSSNGRWEVESTELIIDNYQETAAQIRISGDILRWDGQTFMKLAGKQLPVWDFSIVDGQVQAKTKDKTRILAEEKQNSNEKIDYKISSSLGPYVALQKDIQPTAMVAKRYYEVFNAATNRRIKLTQLFSEGAIFDALLKNKTVKNALASKTPEDLNDLIYSLESDCNLLLDDYLLHSFTFYRLRSSSVEVQIAIPSSCKDQKKRKTTNLVLRLPIPANLKTTLSQAKKDKMLVK